MYDELVKRLREYGEKHCPLDRGFSICGCVDAREAADAIEELSKRPEIPATGIGDLSDGYHTFNGLYYQRMVLFSALVNAYRDRAWKSWKHEDGEPCFGGGWFIVGIDTPLGSYTYHYEDKYWNWFECEELPTAKHWDGHTEKDVTRLLTLAADVVEVVRCRECKHSIMHKFPYNYEKVLACNDPHGVTIRAVKPMHFCSYGERKDGGQDNV